jgi:hypothetical protein
LPGLRKAMPSKKRLSLLSHAICLSSYLDIDSGSRAREFLPEGAVVFVVSSRAGGEGPLAANASNPESRAAYLDLMKQWNMLADEIDTARCPEGTWRTAPF